MKLTKNDLKKYIKSTDDYWADTTSYTVHSKLSTLIGQSLEGDPILKHLLTMGHSKATCLNYLHLISGFEQWKLGTQTTRKFIKKQKFFFANSHNKIRKRLSKKMFEEMLEVAGKKSDSLYNLILLMGRGGLRISEATQVKWKDWTDGYKLQVKGKGGLKREVPFIKKRLIKVEEHQGLVAYFPSYRRFFSTHFPEYSAHDLRSYYITRLLNDFKMPVRDVQSFVGHSNPTTTLGYVTLDFDEGCKKIVKNFENL